MEENIEQQGRSGGLRGWTAVGLGWLSLFLYLTGLFIWLTPLPLLYVYKRAGRAKAVLALFSALLLLIALYYGVIPAVAAKWGSQKALDIFFWVPGRVGGEENLNASSLVFGIYYYGFFALMGILLGEFEASSRGVTRLMVEATAVMAILLTVLVFWYIRGEWVTYLTGLQEYFVAVMTEIGKNAAPNEEMQAQWALLQPHFSEIAHYAVRLLPAMAIDTILFVLWLNIVVARKFFSRENFFPNLGFLRQWRLSFVGVWLVIAIAALLILDVYVLHFEFIRFFAINALMVFALIYFFQGLAIMVFYALRWSVSPMIRMVLYAVLLLFFQPVGFLLMAFGFFDSWFDFRKLTPKVAA